MLVYLVSSKIWQAKQQMTQDPFHNAESVNQAAKELLALPSVETMLIFTLDETLLFKNTKGEIPETAYEQFVKNHCSIIKMGEIASLPTRYIEYKFYGRNTITWLLKDKKLLSVFYPENANKRLIKMMTLNSLGPITEALAPIPRQTAPPRPWTSPAGDLTNDSPIVIKRSLMPRLDIIRYALRAAMPDVDDDAFSAIMDQSIRKWASLGPVSKRELPVLAEILSRTIADEKKKKKFYLDIEDTFLGIRR